MTHSFIFDCDAGVWCCSCGEMDAISHTDHLAALSWWRRHEREEQFLAGTGRVGKVLRDLDARYGVHFAWSREYTPPVETASTDTSKLTWGEYALWDGPLKVGCAVQRPPLPAYLL